MRFVFTLVVPTTGHGPKPGKPIQEVIAEYPATSIQALYADLERSKWGVMVDQFYQRDNKWEKRATILLAADWIAKVKVFVENEPG